MSLTCTVVVCGAPLAARAGDVVAALGRAGWTVHVVTTPAASIWLDESVIAAPVVHHPGHPEADRPSAVVVAPITFNTVGKLTAGIADTFAHGVLCEALGERIPMVAVPMVNDRLWGHPAWARHLGDLQAAGVRVIDIHSGGPDARPVKGDGADVVERFDPAWVVAALADAVAPRA